MRGGTAQNSTIFRTSSSAPDGELVDLCKVVKRFGGYYQPHHRDYGKNALHAYADSIEIGRQAGVPVQLTHAAMNFAPNKGRAGDLLSLVDEARTEGVDVTLDMYPYLAGSTYLHAVFPLWAQAGGSEALLGHLRNPADRSRLRHAMETGSDAAGGVPIDWETLVVTNLERPENAQFVGLSIADAARRAGGREPFDTYCELVVSEGFGAGCLLYSGNEENVRQIMAHPAHMACSDGLVIGARPHPRAWGTFARYLGTYVRDERVIRLEEMVRHMTAAPANRLGLRDRGMIRPGMKADIVVFGATTIRDEATYLEPRRHASGVPHVLVNGVFVKRGNQLTASRPGRVLRRSGQH